MQDDYNTTTLFVGVGIALAIVAVAIIVLNWTEIAHIVATEGLISE
jgi:uncharacterized membrane protein